VKRFVSRGAVVFVTGASSGIGAATAVVLERERAHVVLGARRLERLQALRASFELPAEHLPVVLDVADPRSVEHAFRVVEDRFGKLDALVANAGVGAWYPVHETPEDAVRSILETNVAGVIRCVRAAVPLMRKAQGGRIVLVSSVVGRRGVPFMGVYSASKFALHGLADAMRIELEDDGIAVSVICPGLTRSEFFDQGTGDKGPPPGPEEGETSESVARAILDCLRSGVPELHRASPLHPKRWAGILTQLMPRLVDRKLRAYYRKRRVAHRGVANDPLAVDDEGRALAHALPAFQVGEERVVRRRDVFVEVREEGEVEAVLLGPRALRERVVDGNPEDLGLEIVELREGVANSAHLGRADRGKGKREEQQDDVLLAPQLRERELLGSGCIGRRETLEREVGRRFSDGDGHGTTPGRGESRGF
jgi:NAD(P)-dependent dehydrogenase (short-subunit alcohol dehydrogenase family)